MYIHVICNHFFSKGGLSEALAGIIVGSVIVFLLASALIIIIILSAFIVFYRRRRKPVTSTILNDLPLNRSHNIIDMFPYSMIHVAMT